MQRLIKTRRCFCYFHEECPKCSLLWKFGLDIPLDGVLVTVFVSYSFSCLNDLKGGGGPIARNSLGTLSAISQTILVGMLAVFTESTLGQLLTPIQTLSVQQNK